MPQFPSRRSNSNGTTGPAQKTAVFMDAGAVFFAVRELHENLQLSYPALGQLLVSKGFPATTSADHLRVMWTSVVPQNTGQVRFLQYAERELQWTVRRFHPAEAYMTDPGSLGLSGDARNRLLRFDASIAFAIGRVAHDHRIALITDSFAVAEPLLRAARTAGPGSRNTLAFFGRLLDPRWQRLLRSEEDVPVEFIDLDEHAPELFGARPIREKTGWTDDFLISK